MQRATKDCAQRCNVLKLDREFGDSERECLSTSKLYRRKVRYLSRRLNEHAHEVLLGVRGLVVFALMRLNKIFTTS